MKSKTLMAVAVAGTLMATGAFANGLHNASMHNTQVQTPSSVSESAPWLTGQYLSSGRSYRTMSTNRHSSNGASSGMGASSGGAYDPTMSSMSESIGTSSSVDYWLLGESTSDMSESSIVSDAGNVGFDSTMSNAGSMSYSLSRDESFAEGATSNEGGAGTVAFDSSSTPADAYALGADQHYLVLGALDSFDPSYALVLETGRSYEDIALLEHLSGDFYVLTPIDAMSDV